jgi:hypothetical protein
MAVGRAQIGIRFIQSHLYLSSCRDIFGRCNGYRNRVHRLGVWFDQVLVGISDGFLGLAPLGNKDGRQKAGPNQQDLPMRVFGGHQNTHPCKFQQCRVPCQAALSTLVPVERLLQGTWMPKMPIKVLHLIVFHLDPFSQKGILHAVPFREMMLPRQQADAVDHTLGRHIRRAGIHGPAHHPCAQFGAQVFGNRPVGGDTPTRDLAHHIPNILEETVLRLHAFSRFGTNSK